MAAQFSPVKLFCGTLIFSSYLSEYYLPLRIELTTNLVKIGYFWGGTGRVIFLHQKSNLECNYCQIMGAEKKQSFPLEREKEYVSVSTVNTNSHGPQEYFNLVLFS